MIVYRLSKSAFAHDMTGRGAEKSGGRWNSKGTAVVYTSESRALCTVEIAVHTPLGYLPADYMIVSIEIPDDLPIKMISTEELPPEWFSAPHPHSTQEIGDLFVSAAAFPVLKVPSAVIRDEYNYIINPAHPGSSRIRITGTEPFSFDRRLFE
jgi:RES domain-containing protein